MWSSSRVFGGHYLINQKFVQTTIPTPNLLVHAFTAAGVLPSQYKRMSAFAEMGAVGKQYIDKGRNDKYMDIILLSCSI